MKHIFTFAAAISAAICLFFLVVTAISFVSDLQIRLGQSDERLYTFQAAFGDIKLNGWLTNFGRNNLTMSESGAAGIYWQKQTRPANARNGLPSASGFSFAINAAYPIGLFAILPAAWVLQRRRRKAAATDVAREATGSVNRSGLFAASENRPAGK